MLFEALKSGHLFCILRKQLNIPSKPDKSIGLNLSMLLRFNLKLFCLLFVFLSNRKPFRSSNCGNFASFLNKDAYRGVASINFMYLFVLLFP